MSAGTSSIRMTAASTRMAATMPTPATLMKTWSLGISDAKTTIMMAAAAVITRPVLASPAVMAWPLSRVRSHVSRVWRDGTTTGAMVGGFQRFETVDLGAGIGTVEDRTIFGVFPEGSREMIRLEFRTAELALFEDMPEETAAVPELEVDTPEYTPPLPGGPAALPDTAGLPSSFPDAVTPPPAAARNPGG